MGLLWPVAHCGSSTHRVTNFVALKAILGAPGVFPAFHVQTNEVDEPGKKLIDISQGDEDFIAYF